MALMITVQPERNKFNQKNNHNKSAIYRILVLHIHSVRDETFSIGEYVFM
jgi:hypothetical protein